jgi:hypothetical protein
MITHGNISKIKSILSGSVILIVRAKFCCLLREANGKVVSMYPVVYTSAIKPSKKSNSLLGY